MPQNNSSPDDVLHHQLGNLVQTYAATTKVRVVWALIFAVTAAGLGAVTAGILQTEYEWWHVGLTGILAIAAFGMMIERTVIAVRNRREVVLLHERGFVHRGPRGDEVFAWEEIDAVYQEAKRYTKTFADNLSNVDYELTVDRNDGKRVLLKEFTNVQQLSTAIGQAMTRRWLPWVTAQLEAGERVNLHPFTVTADGIASGDAFVPWSDVNASLHNGTLIVSGWSVSIPSIPNFLLLTTVINRMTALHQRR
ncbi:DUF6585 family protein [Actinopolymorpha alba]|uniref:DUF6585 family protein n=1 Tax=Actinopolymorpha alba TaxID=533267 RepID=UPI0003759146|nr:DUF6585 family protein [Actinopolymorpha alba]